MYKILIVTIAGLAAIQQANSQNLIPNPGFEQCDLCDSRGFKELGIGFGANVPADWNSATFGSPDIYSVQPRSGKRHGGFFTGFGKFEYLANHFTEPLKMGATYRFSFWIAGNSQNLNYIVDEIGIHIQKGKVSYPQSEPLKQLTPSFSSPDLDYIAAKNYRQFSFEYMACGGEDHFIVGRFRDLGKDDTTFVGSKRPSDPLLEAIYYYVDDFEMVEISPGITADPLPPDLELCKDTIKTIRVPDAYVNQNIVWSNGSTSPEISFKNEDLIWVEIRLNDACKTVIRDTMIIKYFKDVNMKILSADSVCTGDTILLQALCNGSDSCFDFIWNNQQKERIAKITKPGIYSVRAKTVCYELERSKEILPSNRNVQTFVMFPNVVTKSGHPENQSFKPYLKPPEESRIQQIEWSLYNRWGQKIFSAHDLNASWQPLVSNPLDTYLYMYKISYQDCNDISTKIFKGHFNLID
ncbi:MAG: gliding motility-associated C-terminal domain-containing protein [Saprospiraceae bacterium]|nr:gliding motility-associated C-terminal domain-containing protein [Saprospiraceae bacterium]